VPGRVQRDVAVALEPPLGVPGGLPVPPEHEPHRVTRGAVRPDARGAGLGTSHDQRGPRPAAPGEPGEPGRAPPAMAGSGSGIRGQSFQSRSSA
jgi:hypothetical protein